jgi:hypothetical protein
MEDLKMRKYFLALILVLAMAMTAMPAFAGAVPTSATAYDYGAINLVYSPPDGGNLLTGWSTYGSIGGERIGNAYAERTPITIKICGHTFNLGYLPAIVGATGDISGKIITKGYAFNDFDPLTYGASDFAGAGAFSKVTGNAWELAGALGTNPQTSTSVWLSGYAGQADWATAQAWASGGNQSGAYFLNSDKDSGGLLSFSETCGEAFTKGETRVFGSVQGQYIAPMDLGNWANSTAWGFTKNFGEGNNGVLGQGSMETFTKVAPPVIGNPNFAETYTKSSFSYNNLNSGWGIAGGYGQSLMQSIPGGVKASSHSFSFAIAK